MDIKGLGETSIPKLLADGFIKTVADVYKLKDSRADLIDKKIFGREKATDKVWLGDIRRWERGGSRLDSTFRRA